MSKFILALIATTFTMTAFADNHATHTMATPMVESATTMAAPVHAAKHSTKEMHAKKAHHHAKQAKQHHSTNQHSTTMQKPATAMPVTN